MSSKPTYRKPPLHSADQVRKLQGRGLLVNDPTEAEVFFRSHNYYRFSAYTYVFEERPAASGLRSHSFRDGVTFEQVKNLYEFDHALRELTAHVLRYVEVGVRTRMCLELSLAHASGHFYLDPSNFKSAEKHTAFLSTCFREAGRSKETFIEHYRKTYGAPELPPLWVMIEILTFGQVSMFFENLTVANQKVVSSRFDLPTDTLASWLACLSYMRNLCVHHSRLWNRKFTKKPQASPKVPPTGVGTYAQAASVMKYLMDQVEPTFPLSASLQALLRRFPEVSETRLGFQGAGLADAFWSP